MQVINLDQYLRLKEKAAVQFFIFFLDDEYAHLNTESTWLHDLRYPTYLVRMSKDDFNCMDIAIHPKIFCTSSGKELFQINGLPNLRYLRVLIKQKLKF